MPEFSTIVVRNDLSELGAAPARSLLEREVLPEYLPKRRWFSSKSEKFGSARFAYLTPLRAGRDNRALIGEIEVKVGDRSERYCLPIGAVDEASCIALAQQLALSRIRRGPLVGYLTDGFACDEFTVAVLDMIRKQSTIRIEGGALQFRKTDRLDEVALPDTLAIRRLSAEQSNSSQIIDDLLVLKIVRKVLAGVHPEAEISRYLTERGYANTPPMYGEVARIDADGTSNTLIVVQGFVRNQGDGWAWTLDFLARAAEDSVAHEDPSHDDAYANYASFAGNLGRRLAPLHEVFAQPTDNPAFRPEGVNDADLFAWGSGVIEQIDNAIAALQAAMQRGDLDEQITQAAQRIIDRRKPLEALVRRLAAKGTGSLRTRVHGDFHLGQVLVVGGDAFLIDFEGEPAKSMEQRRAHSCPLRDVAGMLRSFDYAGATAASRLEGGTEATNERRAQLLERFRRNAGADFLGAYREVLEASATPWIPREAEAAMLDLFLLEKAAYEIHYEANNRPQWITIPLAGFDGIATRLLEDGSNPHE